MCPKCGGKFVSKYLEEGLPNYECSSCGGNWLNVNDISMWIDNVDLEHDFEAHPSETILSEDNDQALRCPFSGAMMAKYRFSAASEHYIDYSAASGSIWLDKGEWGIIKSLNLVGYVPQFFNTHWQKKVVEDSMDNHIENKYREILGDAFDEVSEFKKKFENSDLLRDIQVYLKL